MPHTQRAYIANINSSKSFLCEAVLSALFLLFYVFLDCFFCFYFSFSSSVGQQLRLKFYESFSLLGCAKKWLIVDKAKNKKKREIRINVIPIWGFCRSSFAFYYFIHLRRSKILWLRFFFPFSRASAAFVAPRSE